MSISSQAMKADGKKKIASKGGNKQLNNLQAQEGQALTSSLSGQSQNTAEASVPAEHLTCHEELCNVIVRLQISTGFAWLWHLVVYSMKGSSHRWKAVSAQQPTPMRLRKKRTGCLHLLNHAMC